MIGLAAGCRRHCNGGLRDRADSEYFRRILLTRREALLELAGAGQEAAATVELDQSSVGRLSRMGATQSQAMSREVERRRQLGLRRIEAALRRIESSGYGYCAEYDEPIAVRRLELNPAAPLCIECAGKAESTS